ncbi:MAG: hypothetical protein QM534_10340 [Sediminibacterium sp.]|nr:hypothetical protein [Sediminibacterium sp.]
MKFKLYTVFIILLVVCFTQCKTKQKAITKAEPKPAIPKQNTTVLTYHYDTLRKSKPIKFDYIEIDTIKPETYYEQAFNDLKDMLERKVPLDFKRAVFITENAYYGNRLEFSKFDGQINLLCELIKKWSKLNPLSDYNKQDSTNVKLNGAIFNVLTDTIRVNMAKEEMTIYPYQYEFNDCFAEENWANMFVTKLLATHRGNCHSLPFLYKILAEELNVKAYLAFAPNHIYLRNFCKKIGWYNTELTNAMFPTEAWVMSSGYVSTESIVSGIYMDSLSLTESITVCVNDLAKGYQRKFPKNDISFILKCCDLGLKYYPNYAELLLLKAETHKQAYFNTINKYGLNATTDDKFKDYIRFHLDEMDKTYSLLHKLHYREIPDNMYFEWMKTLQYNKEKYSDTKIINTFNYNKK